MQDDDDDDKDTKVVVHGAIDSEKRPIDYSKFDNGINSAKLGAMNNTKL